jgi:succinate-acetate transporter protein
VNWLLIPAANVNKSIALFLISWTIVMAALTIATLRLPVSYTAVIALVVLALVLRTIGVLNADASLNEEANAIPALESLVLDFDHYGRLAGIRVTGAAHSVLAPSLLEAAQRQVQPLSALG